MPTSLHTYVKRWCHDHGWTDLFVERYQYWAFPPGAVMPMPVPSSVLQSFKSDSPLTVTEKVGYAVAITATVTAVSCSYTTHSPMPLIFAFCCCAIIVALLEEDD